MQAAAGHGLPRSPTGMRIWRSVAGGTVGAATALVLTLATRWIGPASDVVPLLGGIPLELSEAPSLGRLLLAELLLGIVSAFGYAAVFELVLHRAGFVTGMVLGSLHAVAAGFVAAYLPLLAPDPAPRTVPGAFFSFHGWRAIAAFFALHVAFGAAVGVLYRVSPRRTPPPVRWRELHPVVRSLAPVLRSVRRGG